MDQFNQLPVDDWTDQDLLTKDEARERLVGEIRRGQTELDEMNAAAQPDTAAIALLARRLAAMRSIHSEYDTYLDGR